MKKNISILGSTGSIGKTTFKIIEKKKNFYSFYLLSANKNFNLISTQIKKYNPKNIHALTVISAPEGIEKIKANHPDITLITASIDEKLDENWYIVPGLGDMGDRLFGTT